MASHLFAFLTQVDGVQTGTDAAEGRPQGQDGGLAAIRPHQQVDCWQCTIRSSLNDAQHSWIYLCA